MLNDDKIEEILIHAQQAINDADIPLFKALVKEAKNMEMRPDIRRLLDILLAMTYKIQALGKNTEALVKDRQFVKAHLDMYIEIEKIWSGKNDDRR